jgi:hypothetical protein
MAMNRGGYGYGGGQGYGQGGGYGNPWGGQGGGGAMAGGNMSWGGGSQGGGYGNPWGQQRQAGLGQLQQQQAQAYGGGSFANQLSNYKQAGQAAGQDMSWMNTGGISPQFLQGGSYGNPWGQQSGAGGAMGGAIYQPRGYQFGGGQGTQADAQAETQRWQAAHPGMQPATPGAGAWGQGGTPYQPIAPQTGDYGLQAGGTGNSFGSYGNPWGQSSSLTPLNTGQGDAGTMGGPIYTPLNQQQNQGQTLTPPPPPQDALQAALQQQGQQNIWQQQQQGQPGYAGQGGSSFGGYQQQQQQRARQQQQAQMGYGR